MQFFKGNKRIVLWGIITVLASCQASTKSDADRVVPAKIDYEEQALYIIGQSFAALNTQLKAQMTAKGVESAIGFCNLNAEGIVDSLAEYYHADIKRTSLQLRNPENEPTPDELENLQFYKLGIEQEVEFGDQILDTEDTYTYYKPIFVLDACTKCHGKEGESLDANAHAKIKELYPEDAAIGYETGDLRGMWVVKFKK